jgi:single-strand DNA-binding protein
MADINRVILVGRLVRDSDLKYTNSGTAVCKFSVAVNRRKKDGDAWVEEVSFFDVTLWGKIGESLNQFLVKGKQVGLEGELRQDRWEQDGQNRSKVEIIANNIQLLGGGPDRNQRQEGGSDAPSGAISGSKSAGVGSPPVDDFNDDIPF